MVSASNVDDFARPTVSDGEAQGVLPGRMYRHTGAAGSIVRIAKVIDVRPDSMGIPHVHFELRVGYGFDLSARIEETRILTVETFVSLFREPIDH